MVTSTASTSHWLLRAPLLTSFFFYVSVCQADHGMGTSCFQVGSASYSAMTLWRQPAIAVWSWQTTQRSPTRRQIWIRVFLFLRQTCRFSYTERPNTYQRILWLIDSYSRFGIWTLVSAGFNIFWTLVACETYPWCWNTSGRNFHWTCALSIERGEAIYWYLLHFRDLKSISSPFNAYRCVSHRSPFRFPLCPCSAVGDCIAKRRRLSALKILQSEGSLASNWQRSLLSSPRWLTAGARLSENSVGQGCSLRRSTCIMRITGSSNQPPKPGFVDDVTNIEEPTIFIIFYPFFFFPLMATLWRIQGWLCEKGLQHGWTDGNSSAETSLVCVTCLDRALADR